MVQHFTEIFLIFISTYSKDSGAIVTPTSYFSVTTASGSHAPNTQIYKGDLIFEENFNELNLDKWGHEVTLGGGGNWEFQWYTNSRNNSYVEDGNLIIKPTLVADEFGENFLTSANLDLGSECTNAEWYGCVRTGSPTHILNPIKSARLRTINSFSFKYGKVEVRAKLPKGDWLWPAIWMLPKSYVYGEWPNSGEIDIMESRGNRNYINTSNAFIGSQLVMQTLHWGPAWDFNRYELTSDQKTNPLGWDQDFHRYQLFWNENSIKMGIDDEILGTFEPPAGGFWEWGDFGSSGFANPWKGSNSKLAPFDQEFHLILNLACGGTTGYFPDPDKATNQGGKPWTNGSPTGMTDFWQGRGQWLPTWDLQNTDNAEFKIDYVRVWAL